LGLSLGFGALLTYTETSLLSGGPAQATFGGVLSILAVGFVTWMIFWMRSAGRGICPELQGRLDGAVAVGSSAVVMVAFIAVAREGLETALFLFAAGSVTFVVQNLGSQLNEFYVYDKAGANIVVEVESGGPGLTGELTAQLAAGSYITACKPGGTGNGIRGTLTVTSGSTTSPSNGAHLATAVADCKALVATEAAALLTRTTTFVTAVKRGDVAAAKAAYPSARVHWERIEPVAESFGDLDPKLDARENDVEPATGSSPGHLADHPLRDAGGRAGHVQQRRGLCPVFRAEQSAGQELVRPGGLVVRTAVQADRHRGRITPWESADGHSSGSQRLVPSPL